MQRHISGLLLVSPLLLGSALLAQTPATSPRGLDLIEGNMAFAHWGASRRLQQIDNTHTGRPMLIQNFASRRNGGNTQSPTARTFLFTLDLGRCDFGRVSQDMDLNFMPGTRQTVFAGQVNFPDWSTTFPGPAPFDFKVPLTTPFVYVGTDAIVIDFTTQNNSAANSTSTDRDYNQPGGGLTGIPGTLVGSGCVSTGQGAPFSHSTAVMNQGALPDPRYALRFRIEGKLAPANSGVMIFIDTRDRNITGALCTTLHALPTIMFTVAADATGRVPETFFGFPYDQALENAAIYSQLLAIDAGQPGVPLTVSNASRSTIPSFNGTTSHPCTYSWYVLPFVNHSFVFFGGGLVFELS